MSRACVGSEWSIHCVFASVLSALGKAPGRAALRRLQSPAVALEETLSPQGTTTQKQVAYRALARLETEGAGGVSAGTLSGHLSLGTGPRQDCFPDAANTLRRDLGFLANWNNKPQVTAFRYRRNRSFSRAHAPRKPTARRAVLSQASGTTGLSSGVTPWGWPPPHSSGEHVAFLPGAHLPQTLSIRADTSPHHAVLHFPLKGPSNHLSAHLLSTSHSLLGVVLGWAGTTPTPAC